MTKRKGILFAALALFVASPLVAGLVPAPQYCAICGKPVFESQPHSYLYVWFVGVHAPVHFHCLSKDYNKEVSRMHQEGLQHLTGGLFDNSKKDWPKDEWKELTDDGVKYEK
jgi:hypothetical protein